MKVLHSTDAKFFMDGPEVCRQYIATEKNYFWKFHTSSRPDWWN